MKICFGRASQCIPDSETRRYLPNHWLTSFAEPILGMQLHSYPDPCPQAATPADHIVVHYDAQLYGRTLQNKQQALQAALGGADDVRRYQVQMQLTHHMPSQPCKN